MEVARVLSGADVETDRSIRFALWNNEETGFNGSVAYVQQRAALQGKENPPGSGRYPEPKWLGMIQHDMMLWDHGLPRAVLPQTACCPENPLGHGAPSASRQTIPPVGICNAASLWPPYFKVTHHRPDARRLRRPGRQWAGAGLPLLPR
jgi:hypothetical protein